MTISVGGVARVSYTGNGVTVAFTTPQFLANADIVATLVVDATGVETLQVLTTNYTLTGAGAASGTLTMLVAPPTGTTLVIYTDPEISQNVDLVNGDPLDVNTGIETPLDKLTLLYRRARNLVARSLRLPEGDVGFVDADTYLPAKVTRASKYLAFDANGKPVATAGTADATPHTATGVLIAASTSAANARSIIGAAASGLATASGLTQNTAKLLGRTTASAGAIEEITPGADMTLAAGALGVAAATTSLAGKVELATTAETQTGTDAARVVTPAGLKAAIGFSNFFESTEQTITTLTDTGSIAHGLGSAPKLFATIIRCKTAEYGYAIGDEVLLVTSNTSIEGLGGYYNATNVGFVISTDVRILDRTGGVVGTVRAITMANWKVVLRAWA